MFQHHYGECDALSLLTFDMVTFCTFSFSRHPGYAAALDTRIRAFTGP
jgi:hypothetical protein